MKAKLVFDPRVEQEEFEHVTGRDYCITCISPEIRRQLAAHYREWETNRARARGGLKCNRCKQYFDREDVIRVYHGRWWNSYCPECYRLRNPRR